MADELKRWDEELLNAATEARSKAYAPYSQFAVGAALLTESGEIISGCNVENATFGATNCAERSAIFTAVSKGHRQFKAIAVVADTLDPITPCGICRQVLAEFGPDTEVLCGTTSGKLRKFRLSELLPHAFVLEQRSK